MPGRPSVAGAVDRLVRVNTAHIHRVDGDAPNPRPVADEPWYDRVVGAHASIRGEWDAFEAAGLRLPLIDEMLGGWQGNVGGWWRTGALISRGRPRAPLAPHFPATVAALLEIPGLLSAIWSVLGPGAELPPHQGVNAGALNLLVGVDTPPGSGHEIEGRPVSLADGAVVIFDDTRPHAAWNRSDRPRVLLIGDVRRPLPGLTGRANAVVQWASNALLPAYGQALERNAELYRALNG